jgi:RNA polymerase sigma-70 factor (ECF subfamily)
MPEASESEPAGFQGSYEFRTTHWTVVLAAGEPGSARATAALEALCRSYWFPVYACARRKGCSPEDAEDLTQEFLTELIARGDLAGLGPARGKFRSFLLACLNHFMAKEWRARRALKRGGGQPLIHLDVAGAEERLTSAAGECLDPERLFDQRWAYAVMEEAISKLEREMIEAGKGTLFEELKVFLTAAVEAGGYAPVAERLQIAPDAVAIAVHRLRKRYRELVRATLANTVATHLELEEEMHYLLEVLSQ